MKNRFVPAQPVPFKNPVTSHIPEVKGKITPCPPDPKLGKAQPGSWLAQHRARMGKESVS